MPAARARDRADQILARSQRVAARATQWWPDHPLPGGGLDQLADRGHKTRQKVMSSANADTYRLPEKAFERFLRFFSTRVS
jgi:hypothetical protein